jgi:RNA polymerase-binding transcription factor
VDHPVLIITVGRRYGERGEMKTPPTELAGFQEILERKQAELTRVWRQRADIAIEKSADQMDEIQYASERDLAIRHVDRESTLLRQLKAALERIQDGSFGNWIDCDSKISPKRLAAVPMGPSLYPLPGCCRSERTGESGCERASRQCRVIHL